MILADTSIWVDYLRNRNPEMERLLGGGQIMMHPFIVAEISLGSLHNRQKMLDDLEALLEVNVAALNEVRHMIESHTLYSKGIGLTDAHLLASCLMTPGTQLWTRDGALKNVAAALGILVNLPLTLRPVRPVRE
jgi:predicted nucleic acid-binding protein